MLRRVNRYVVLRRWCGERRLEELTVNGEMMIEKIDKVTEEQV